MCVPKDALLKSLALEDGIRKVQVHVWTGHLGGRSLGHLMATQLGHKAAGVRTPSVSIHMRSGQCRGGHGWTPSGFRARGKAVPTRCWHLDPHPPTARPAQPTPTPPQKPCPEAGGRAFLMPTRPPTSELTQLTRIPTSRPALQHWPQATATSNSDSRHMPGANGRGPELTTAPPPQGTLTTPHLLWMETPSPPRHPVCVFTAKQHGCKRSPSSHGAGAAQGPNCSPPWL